MRSLEMIQAIKMPDNKPNQNDVGLITKSWKKLNTTFTVSYPGYKILPHEGQRTSCPSDWDDCISAAVNVAPHAPHAREEIFTTATPFLTFLSCS